MMPSIQGSAGHSFCMKPLEGNEDVTALSSTGESACLGKSIPHNIPHQDREVATDNFACLCPKSSA